MSPLVATANANPSMPVTNRNALDARIDTSQGVRASWVMATSALVRAAASAANPRPGRTACRPLPRTTKGSAHVL